MRIPEGYDDWKGWLPGKYHCVMEVRSSNLIGDITHFVKTALLKDGRFGGAKKQIEVAEAMEKLARDIREGKLK